MHHDPIPFSVDILPARVAGLRASVVRLARTFMAATLCATVLPSGLFAQTQVAAPGGRAPEYVIGPADVLLVTVFDQGNLTGKYTVENDGTINFPLLGRVKAAGFTQRSFEADLRKRLVDGYLKNPQVSIVVEQFRSQRIFIVGEVRAPGQYPLTGDMTLIEALARAGVNATAGDAVIVRAVNATGPVLPGQDGSAEVIKIPMKALESGKLSQNIPLRDGDTIFIPKAESIYVFGFVRSPGSYAVQKDTTILQALSLAGGVLPNAAMGRIKIVRMVNGKEKQIKVKLADIVKAGDTIVVPERFF